jgi:molybdate transport system permease protein
VSWTPLLLSLQVAATATLICAVFGIGLAACLSGLRSGAGEIIDVLATAPMVLPPTVLGYYVLVLLGRDTMLGRSYEAFTGGSLVFSRSATVLAATIAGFPFVLKSARVAFEEIDPRLIAAAQTLGAGPLRIFFAIRVPLARAGLAAGLGLGFARSLGEFGLTLMIAGDLPGLTQTGSLAIYDAVQASRDSDAATMVAVMTSMAICLLYLVNRAARRKRHGF